MQDDQKLCYDKELFCNRVQLSMHRAKLDWEQVSVKFGQAGYPITAQNLRTYVTQRNLSLKVLIHLSQALGVSMDYLIGNDSNSPMMFFEGFDYEFSGQRYNQYDGVFSVYFYPTRTNEPEKIIIASLQIDAKKNYMAVLEIPLDDAPSKVFTGNLLLSRKTDTAFLNMKGVNGEMLQLTFNDPNTFQNKMRFCIAGLLSVSSGDAKRMPTLSRAVICDKPLKPEAMDFIAANLKLNSKYIPIQKDKLELVMRSFCKKENIENCDDICNRVMTAFKPRTQFYLEEQYFLNTFRNENNLSDIEVERLIVALRMASECNINSKIPRSIDARLYLLLKQENLFIEVKE